MLAQILEATMMAMFGLSWPINALKAWRARTAVATSLPFLLLITFGYVVGIASKIVGNNVNWVVVVYAINLALLIVNVSIYFRNARLDKLRAAEEA